MGVSHLTWGGNEWIKMKIRWESDKYALLKSYLNTASKVVPVKPETITTPQIKIVRNMFVLLKW